MLFLSSILKGQRTVCKESRTELVVTSSKTNELDVFDWNVSNTCAGWRLVLIFIGGYWRWGNPVLAADISL